MIEFRDVTFKYHGSHTPILEKVSFSIECGECVGLLGSSGSGKSTLANIAAGFLIPETGHVLVNGNLVTGVPSRKIILINQECDLFQWQTVWEHIEFVIQEKDSVRIQKIIDLVRLQGSENKYPNQLSGGMKKRLSLARALAVNPEILILDEAFSSLDYSLKIGLYSDLKEIWKEVGTSILLIAHDSSDINYFSQRTFVLHEKKARILCNT